MKTLSNSSGATAARLRRVKKGDDTEAQAKAMTPKTSLQGLMQLPLLEAIDECGGRARPGEVYDILAERMGLDEAALSETRLCGDGQEYKVFQQQVRWARQTAVLQGLIAGERGVWELADPAYGKLQKARRGTLVMIYRVSDGLALWGHAEDAAAAIERGSVNLIMTSPPYPVVKREYGRFTVPEWLSWMKRLTGMWTDLLAEDGTIAINLMDVFVSGTPALSPYVERFTLSAIDDHGLYLAGRMPWHSPSKLGNIQWTAKEKVRPKNTMEHVILFSKSPKPAWDITRMPRGEYGARSAAKAASDAKRSAARRPSGYDINPKAFNGQAEGPLPGNLIIAGGASGSDAYSRRCRELGIDAHPARYPEELPRRIITLTTAPGELVYDPMAGSNTTGKVASDLGRRFIASEAMRTYAEASALRFDHRPDFARA